MSAPVSPDSPVTCPRCGSPLADSDAKGLCHACLMAEVMQPSAPRRRWEPPTASELAALLPQYEIDCLLGRGGMGAVYKGRQKSLDRPVAVKILPTEVEDLDPTFVERFKNEARAMAKLAHPGIVAVYDSGETANGLLFIVMEYIEGTDVARMISQSGRLRSEYAMAITAHVCDALAYAHERGIIHRDIKPANIMVGQDGAVKVADFGLAKMPQGRESSLTQSGAVMGTLHYMAPEALMMGNVMDERADIYAVGVMLYQMLTGRLPQGFFELPSMQIKGLDPRYDGIIAKALREDRDLRYQQAVEMRHDLDAILTQPVVKAEAKEVREVVSKKQLGSHKPQRSLPPRVIVRTETKTSPLPWVALLLVCGLAAWLYLKDDRQDFPAVRESPPASTKNTTPYAAEKSHASSAATLPNSPAQVPPPVPGTVTPAAATKGTPFVNTLGMKFVPVPITGDSIKGKLVLFSIWETRVQDYEQFVRLTTRSWSSPPFPQTQTHPAVGMSWNDAAGFCQWMTVKERKDGRIDSESVYRLPSDVEWSHVAGSMEHATNGTVLAASREPRFPWGDSWPPPDGAGNYLGAESLHNPFKDNVPIKGYRDNFDRTAPVGSFAPSPVGLFDLSGNAMEWCADLSKDEKRRTLRGGAWSSLLPSSLETTFRGAAGQDYASLDLGFRMVLEVCAPEITPPEALAAGASPNDPNTTAPLKTKKITDLIAIVDPARHARVGTWQKTPEGLRAHTDAVTEHRLLIPRSPTTATFDYEAEFTLTRDKIGAVALEFLLHGKVRKCDFQFYPNPQGAYFRIVGLDGILTPSWVGEGSVFLSKLFKPGIRYTIGAHVRPEGIAVMLDGRTVIDWKGDFGRLSNVAGGVLQPLSNAQADDPGLGVCIGDGFFGRPDGRSFSGGAVFHKLTLTEYPEVPPPPATPVKWTDTKGRSLEGIFKEMAGDRVFLDIAGKVQAISLGTLSDASRQQARDFHTRQQAQPPAAGK